MDQTEREFQKVRLRNKQRHLNKLFEKFGLTDDILEEQLKINEERNSLDIPDEEEFVFENFVQ